MSRNHVYAAALLILSVAGCESTRDPVAPRGEKFSRSTGASSSVSGNYDYVAFDVPGGNYTSVFGVNSSSLVTGNYENADGTVHGFLARKGAITDVSIPGAVGFYNGALGPVNDLGDAAGTYSDGDDVVHGFIRSRDGTITELPMPVAGALELDPAGLNNYGTLVGYFRDAAFRAHGFILRNGTYEQYDYPGSTSTRVNGINDRDVMVGQFGAAGVQHAFIMENGETSLLEFPGAVSTRAAAINNRGDIVGFYNNSDGVFHGFLYSDGEFTTIDFPGSSDSFAGGISNKGVIVGTYNEFSFGFIAYPAHAANGNTDVIAGH